jgi:hypothetical protein
MARPSISPSSTTKAASASIVPVDEHLAPGEFDRRSGVEQPAQRAGFQGAKHPAGLERREGAAEMSSRGRVISGQHNRGMAAIRLPTAASAADLDRANQG